MPNIIRIAIYSFQDQIRHKSFYILLGVCILLVLLLRGCYKGDAVINNQHIDSLTVAWYASKIAFHIIAGGMMLLTTLISMNIFSRDRQNGTMLLMLSKPMKRSDYVLGRITGVWILVTLFMLILHLTIVIISFVHTGEIHPEFFLASILCSLNLLFLILLVSLLSMFLPEFLAAATVIGVAGISFISDSFYLAKHSQIMHSVVSSGIDNSISLWRILWPKTAMLQYYAASIIDDSSFNPMSPIHPVFNIIFFIGISCLLLLTVFSRREI